MDKKLNIYGMNETEGKQIIAEINSIIQNSTTSHHRQTVLEELYNNYVEKRYLKYY